jgi:hypothetical protein
MIPEFLNGSARPVFAGGFAQGCPSGVNLHKSFFFHHSAQIS